MNWDIMSFLTIVIFVFAIVMVIAGIFSAYFGSGKSRTYGMIMLAVGAVVLALWTYLVGYSDITLFSDVAAWDVMYNTLISLIAVLIGALVAVGIFLVAVLKS